MSPSQQQQQQQRNGSRSQRSIMDLRNLCQRLDVDSLKGMFAIWSLSTLYKTQLRVYWTVIYTLLLSTVTSCVRSTCLSFKNVL